jgi:hypothetical protein
MNMAPTKAKRSGQKLAAGNRALIPKFDMRRSVPRMTNAIPASVLLLMTVPASFHKAL